MSPKSNDYLGEVIATAYLLFVGLVLSYIVPAVLPKGMTSLGMFQVGFALGFAALVIIRLTSYDLSALAVSVVGLAINDAGLRVAMFDFEQWIMLLILVQTLCCAAVMVITHIRDGIYERSPVI